MGVNSPVSALGGAHDCVVSSVWLWSSVMFESMLSGSLLMIWYGVLTVLFLIVCLTSGSVVGASMCRLYLACVVYLFSSFVRSLLSACSCVAFWKGVCAFCLS